MCGLAGYVGRHVPGLAEQMARLIEHRGPDDEGIEALNGPGGEQAVLAHRRLSIIDLAGGHQPLGNEDGTVRIVFNGEIYNFAELRRDLEARGHRFATRSDTEVIVHLYEDDPDGFVSRLRGMFAFALYDTKRGRLVLARDRLGKKPLYYAPSPAGAIEIAFASELKCLFQVPGVSREIDLEALASYLTYLYIPHPLTIVRGARKLPPGHMLVADRDGVSVRRYWGLDPDSAGTGQSDPERLWELLADSVDARLVADVPVGAYLSGGVDSSSIVAAASVSSPGMSTYTVAFSRESERRYDESADARVVADAFATDHHELVGDPNLGSLLPTIVRHFDEPFGNPTALIAYALAELTRQHVKVVLGGEGSDELFAGYLRFRGLVELARYRKAPRVLRQAAAGITGLLPESTSGRHLPRRLRRFTASPDAPLEDVYTSWVSSFDPAARERLLAPAVAERLRGTAPPETFIRDLFSKTTGDLVNRISFVELQSYLPCNVLEYNDRMSMAHGLELRSPYCDHLLVEYAFGLPAQAKLRGRETKAVLRDALRERLPARPLQKSKVGFNPPIGVWLRGELSSLLDSHLSREQVAERGLLQPDAVSALVSTLRSGRRDVSQQVWALVVLEQWLREYHDGAAAS